MKVRKQGANQRDISLLFSSKVAGTERSRTEVFRFRSETLVGEEDKALHLGTQAINKKQDEGMKLEVSRYRQEMLGQEEGSSLQTSCLISFNKRPIQMLPDISLSLLGKTISPVPFAKDLGVYVDQYLIYDVHTTKTASSYMKQLVQISRIKHLLDKKTLLLLINSFVLSKLFYCSLVWGNTSKRNLHKLQLVQNFTARVVLGLRKFDHISQGRRSLSLLDVSIY